MKPRFVYVGNGQIQCKDRVLTEGTILRDGELSDGELAHFVKQGLIQEAIDDVPTHNAPPPAKPAANTNTQTDTKPPAKEPEPPVSKPQHPANWGYSPEMLKGKTLEELNILIRDHAERLKILDVPPMFETVEEAISLLGMDLNKP